MTTLVPVAQWVFNLYRVTYHRDAGAPADPQFTRHVVSTDTHVEGEVLSDDAWPNSEMKYARWDPVVEGVRRPRQVGTFYGQRIDESGWAAGSREARERGLGER